MQITVGSYYTDDSTGRSQEGHITLSDSDGAEVFSNSWDNISNAQKAEKLALLADLYGIQFAKVRGLQREDLATSRMSTILTALKS